LDLLSRCSSCNSRLGNDAVSLISKEKTKTVFHTFCHKCQSNTLIIISGGARGLMAIGMATDLNKDEAREKIRGKTISADEVIAAYEMINEKQEDLKSKNL